MRDMKSNLLLALFLGFSLSVAAQYDTVTVRDIQFVDQTDLANCNDTSAYYDDTVVVVGVVMHNGNLTEIASGSVNGNYRPAVNIVDTSMNAQMGDFRGIEVHGVYVDAGGQNQPVSALNQLVAGDIIFVTGWVNRFSGQSQINPIDNSSVIVSGFTTPPQPTVVNVGDLNDVNRTNILETGEEWEGSFVEIQNVTVTAVNFFSGNSRVSLDVADANGNTINISDRYMVQKLPGHTAVNPASPQSNGSFVPPAVGTQYASLKGIILHSENGCTGAGGRGYELNPFDTSHYEVGVTPPLITSLTRTPTMPTSTETALVGCSITDSDGSIATAEIYYTNDISGGNFTQANLSLVSGSTDEYEYQIPSFSDGTMIGYYLRAVDNAGNETIIPTPSGGNQPVIAYTVRDNGATIVDLQMVLDYNNDESYYEGEEMTVTGIVTATTKDWDIGYVYIQQPGANEWSGINLVGDPQLATLSRGQEVTVTGEVEEDFGFTRLRVNNVVVTGNTAPLETTYINPSDSDLYNSGEMEKYEGMLIGLVHSTPGTSMKMMNENADFGDYVVGDDTTLSQGTRVLAGRQNSRAFSSLWVSLVTDSFYVNNEGIMQVDPVITTPEMEMDTIIGQMYYSFSNYRLLPRSNYDIINLLDDGVPVDLPDTTTNITTIDGRRVETVLFPNPAESFVNVAVDGYEKEMTYVVYDITGRVVSNGWLNPFGFTTIDLQSVSSGILLIEIRGAQEELISINKVLRTN
jgi:DNA/RNA endonuclease YhcR with UshA esterase domain